MHVYVINYILQAICELGGESYVETCKKLKYCVLDENEKDLHVTIKKFVKGIRGNCYRLLKQL